MLKNLGSGYADPGEDCDHYIHHHEVNTFTSIISRHHKL